MHKLTRHLEAGWNSHESKKTRCSTTAFLTSLQGKGGALPALMRLKVAINSRSGLARSDHHGRWWSEKPGIVPVGHSFQNYLSILTLTSTTGESRVADFCLEYLHRSAEGQKDNLSLRHSAYLIDGFSTSTRSSKHIYRYTGEGGSRIHITGEYGTDILPIGPLLPFSWIFKSPIKLTCSWPKERRRNHEVGVVPVGVMKEVGVFSRNVEVLDSHAGAPSSEFPFHPDTDDLRTGGVVPAGFASLRRHCMHQA